MRRIAGLWVGVVLAAVVWVASPFVAPVGAEGSTTIELPVLPAGNPRLVDAAYKDFLGRVSEAGGRAYWVGQLDGGLSRSGLTLSMARSPEWLRRLVTRHFEVVVGRAPTAAELDKWVGDLAARRATPASLVASLLGSVTFYAAAGTSPGPWLDAMFEVVLGRVPSSSEATYWLGQLTSGKNRTEIGRTVYLSLESNGRRVDDLYLLLLRRAAEPGGRSYWAERLKTTDDVVLAAQLASSAEYLTLAQQRQVEGTIVQPSTTLTLQAAQVSSVQPSGDGIAFSVGASLVPATVQHVSIGIGPSVPEGFLGSVEQRVITGAMARVTLAPAPLGAAFTEWDIHGVQDLLNLGRPASAAARAGQARAPCTLGGLTLKDPFLAAQPPAQARLDTIKRGTTSYVDLRVDVGFRYGVDIDATRGLSCEGNFPLVPQTPVFPTGPIVWTAGWDFRVEVETGAQFRASVSLGMGCTIGGLWRSGSLVANYTNCTPPRDVLKASWRPDGTTFDAELAFGPVLSMRMYGQPGIEAFPGMSLTGSVRPGQRPTCTLTTKGRFEAAFTPGSLIDGLLDIDVELANFEIPAPPMSCDLLVERDDTYIVPSGVTRTISPRGVLTNDEPAKRTTALLQPGGTFPAAALRWNSTNDGGFTLDTRNVNPGTYTFRYRLAHPNNTGSVGAPPIATVTITVTPALSLSTTNLPIATRGSAYTTTLAAAGGTPPYRWSATGLPPGLAITSNGTITGTPAQAGTTNVVLRVTDNDDTVRTRTLPLTVRADATVTATCGGVEVADVVVVGLIDANGTVELGQTVAVLAGGPLDPPGTVDFGDGTIKGVSGPVTCTVGEVSNQFHVALHTYTRTGLFRITVNTRWVCIYPLTCDYTGPRDLGGWQVVNPPR